MAHDVSVPRYEDLLLTTLRAIWGLGGSGSVPEITTKVAELAGLTEEQQEALHLDGPQTEIAYQVAWCRTYLRHFGFLTNSSRGVWAITEEGENFLHETSMTDEQRTETLRRQWAAKQREQRAARAPISSVGRQPATKTSAASNFVDEVWKERLIGIMTSADFSPAQFERLTQRLLREADFESVTVTGRSGDRGIDGVGIYRLGLLTFPVFFQCKRYMGTVGPGEVRDFRGAMQGRGEKGILITTGTFTTGAKEEASRDGATPIDLIDGDRLCDLLKRYELGVATRTVEEITVDPGFFGDI